MAGSISGKFPMRIAQILLLDASLYERKCQRLDAEALRGTHDVQLVDDARGFDLAHVYGPRVLPRRRFGVPYIASGTMARRWWAPHLPPPVAAVAPVEDDGFTLLPEAVDDAFFAPQPEGTVIGAVVRPSVRSVIELTMHRMARTRDDLPPWRLFDAPPTPAEMAEISVWIDPATDDHDYDGATAEALAAGRVVVASRTPVNVQRTEKGRTALLVPPGDPNELTHAILSALFKSEVGRQRAVAAKQTISKFRSRQRMRLLLPLYETLLP
jgi:hypothetical protein